MMLYDSTLRLLVFVICISSFGFFFVLAYFVLPASFPPNFVAESRSAI